MRLWIGPEGEMVDLDLEDRPHSLAVAQDPERFGLAPGPLVDHLAECDDPDLDVEFDYDTVILLAETKGWTRISRDATAGTLAVSAASETAARRAIRLLEGRGHGSLAFEVEIERFDGGFVRRSLHRMDMRQAAAFMRGGRLPAGRSHVTLVDRQDLLASLEVEVGLKADSLPTRSAFCL